MVKVFDKHIEEAQDNKSTMRLRRDSQGNYRYQYVADEDNVKKAEEDLQKARVDLYNFDKERMKSTHNDILALEKDFRDKLKEIETNSSYSEEESSCLHYASLYMNWYIIIHIPLL